MRYFLTFLFISFFLSIKVFAQNLDPLWEIWKYEHGITIEEYTTSSGQANYYITWSSSAGSPWTHDVFNRIVCFSSDGSLITKQNDKRYISVWEAQEPISTSINPANNYIFSVFEDGSDSNIPNEAVNVHGQIHLPDGTIIKKNFLIAGGPDAQHSAVGGHIKNKFLAVYVDDNMGDSGISAVKIRVYDDETGDSLQTLDLTPLTEYHWWPVIESTSSHSRALCVWIEDTENLNAAVVYEQDGKVKSTPYIRILEGTQFVNQQVNWLEHISKFVVIAKRKGSNNSKLCLIDTLGNKTLQRTVPGAVFQEAKPAVKWDENSQSYIYIYPTGKNDLNVLKITDEQISFYKKIIGDENSELQPFQWKATGIWSKFIQDTTGNTTWNNRYIILFVMGDYNTDGVHLIPVHIDTNIFTGISDFDGGKKRPREFRLFKNYPNPFNPTTTISYQLTKTCKVELSIYSLLGKKIQSLVKAQQNAGRYSVRFEATGLPSGVYFAHLRIGNQNAIQKMILIQ